VSVCDPVIHTRIYDLPRNKSRLHVSKTSRLHALRDQQTVFRRCHKYMSSTLKGLPSKPRECLKTPSVIV
jgi:hypothetical protein